jgi:hypothetical protein
VELAPKPVVMAAVVENDAVWKEFKSVRWPKNNKNDSKKTLMFFSL